MFAYLRQASLRSALTVAAGTQAGAYALSTFGRDEPTEHYYDISGTVTHLLIIAHTVGASTVSRRVAFGGARVALLAGLASVWTVRLGAYLYNRVSRVGGDSRFDELKRNPVAWPLPWALQALWCTSLQAPLVIAAAARAAPTRLTRWDAAGAAVFLGGLALEAVADAQKDAAKRLAPRDPVTSGVFKWSVYPQYFGELSLWCGAAMLALPTASRPWHALAALAAPCVDAALILGVSGLPLSEASSWRRYGGNAAWLRYRACTNLVFPAPPAREPPPGALEKAKARAAAVAG